MLSRLSACSSALYILQVNDRRRRRVAHFFFVVVEMALNLRGQSGIVAMCDSVERCGTDDPALVRSSIYQSLSALRIGIVSQDLGGSGSNGRGIVFRKRLYCSNADSCKGNKAYSLLKAELGHLLWVSQGFLLLIAQTRTRLSFAGKHGVVDVVAQRIAQGDQGA